MAEPNNPPGFWKHETSGVLRPAVWAYLSGKPMTPDHVASMRAYLRQWISAPVWRGDEIIELRERVEALTTREAITAWLDDAAHIGIDPL
jgi:hypothetical protein